MSVWFIRIGANVVSKNDLIELYTFIVIQYSSSLPFDIHFLIAILHFKFAKMIRTQILSTPPASEQWQSSSVLRLNAL